MRQGAAPAFQLAFNIQQNDLRSLSALSSGQGNLSAMPSTRSAARAPSVVAALIRFKNPP
jgi:hypothetical protein